MRQTMRRTIRHKTQGLVLLIALIGLAAMTIAAGLLARSVFTGNLVTGNIALRQSVERTVAIGFEKAMDQLLAARKALEDRTDDHLEIAWSSAGFGTACASGQCWYSPTELYSQDSSLPSALAACSITSSGYATNVPMGIPTCTPIVNRSIEWFDATAFTPFNSDSDPNIPAGYSVRYIIDRQCASESSNDVNYPDSGSREPPRAANVKAVRKFCRIAEKHAYDPVQNYTGDKYPFDNSLNAIPQVYYRISVQVTGPRATTHFAQAVVLI